MSWNSAQSLAEGDDSLGYPQFQGEDSFFLVQNGLIIQGGLATAPGSGDFNIPFPAPLSQQLLTVQITRRDVSNHIYISSVGTDLSNLQVHLTGGGGSFYWFAIGV
jgi:hypothetical protein